MTFLSAEENFMLRTLDAVHGRWAKLCYVAGLRQEDGTYAHWGLERMYGSAAAIRTISEAHQVLFLDTLRTPIPQLWRDVQETAAARKTPTAAFLTELNASAARLVPQDFAGGSTHHFSSVLLALSGLAKSRAARSGA